MDKVFKKILVGSVMWLDLHRSGWREAKTQVREVIQVTDFSNSILKSSFFQTKSVTEPQHRKQVKTCVLQHFVSSNF